MMHNLGLNVAACVVFGALSAVAETIPVPKSPTILTITGVLERTNAGDAAVFDMAMLKALPSTTFTTTTIWTDGVQSFTGVPLRALLDAVGAEGSSVVATAINDYAVVIPLAETTPSTPIIAYMRNGRPMTVRDKGPLWVIYPFDSDPSYQSEIVYSRSIWQLDRIEVAP